MMNKLDIYYIMNGFKRTFKDLFNGNFNNNFRSFYNTAFGSKDLTQVYIGTFGNNLEELFM